MASGGSTGDTHLWRGHFGTGGGAVTQGGGNSFGQLKKLSASRAACQALYLSQLTDRVLIILISYSATMSQGPRVASQGSQEEEEEDFFGLDDLLPVRSPCLFTLFSIFQPSAQVGARITFTSPIFLRKLRYTSGHRP